MRKIFTLSFLLLTCSAFAQRNLSLARQGSLYTYVYKLSLKEADELYRSDMNKVADRYLHTLVDSFRSEEPPLPPGNYLFAGAIKNRLHVELKATGDLHFKLINNDRDLVVALHRKNGEWITDATVSINNKPLHYDAATQTFRKEKYRKGGLLKVRHNNTVYAFTLEPVRRWNPQLSFWKKLGRSFPLRYLVQPISRLFGKKRPGYRNFFYQTPYERIFRGFMAFSKPKYKPGDTVKLKAFVTTARGRPLDQKLLLRLCNRHFDTDTILTALTPYRKGGYEGSFVLHDSLDIDLDEEYLVTLETEESRRFSIGEDDDNEEAIAARRKVVMRGNFFYEEYELKSTRFTVRSSKEEHSRGEDVSVFAKATDENDMAVRDGRMQVIVKPSSYSTRIFGAPVVFLPDTLWQYEQALETVGETRLTIPDSIFPKARFNYDIECIFLNSNNERQTQTLRQTFDHGLQRLQFTEDADSLHIQLLEKGRSVPAPATLYLFTAKDDTIEQRTATLPTTIRLHPFAKTYEVETGSLDEEYEVKGGRSVVSALASRTKDSVFIQLVNPYKLPVWYTVFAGNKVLLRGKADSLFYAAKVRTAKNYFVSLQYMHNGMVRNEDFTVPYQNKLLNVKLVQPDVVYPGQTAAINIAVSDAEGKPVAGADVTAWAVTKKFDNLRMPLAPYSGKLYPGRKRYNNFKEEETDFQHNIKLTWERWSREMHLDTMEYYRFLRPQHFYTNTEAAPDSLTQVAPFLVKNGEVLPVHLLYIDEAPAFFNAAGGLKRYSFAVSPGRHALRFRTHNSLVSVDSIWVENGMKTFLSINADTGNKRIRIQPMPDSLTSYEKSLWSKYMILVDAMFGEKFASIESGRSLHLLNADGRNGLLLAGPLTGSAARFNLKNGFTQDFETEGGYLYQFRRGLIRQKQWYNLSPLRIHLSAAPHTYSFRDFVLTEKEIDSLWAIYLYNRSASEELFRNPQLMKKGNGELQIGVTKDSTGREPFVRNILLFKYTDPDYLRIYKGASRNLGYVEPGKYRLFLLLKGDRYFIRDSVIVKKDGVNYYETGTVVPKERDSVSLRISSIINSRDKALWYNESTTDFNSIKETFNERYLDSLLRTETVSGIVTDDKGGPIIGATVFIKGTRAGTTTDRYGRFTLRTLPGSTLVITSVGFGTEERKLDGSGIYRFSLAAAKQSLSEVVVVGYGTQRRQDLTGATVTVSANALQGRLAGVMVRGTGSVTVENAPLIVVDGLPYSGSLSDLDPALVASAAVLKGEQATAIYGARGANGVVMISTRKNDVAGATDPLQQSGNTLRTAFRDDAWWQPKLRTNAAGIASFRVTYPDDITAWRTFAVAMTDNRQSGTTESMVRSFKAVSGNLALPQFTVEGDSMKVIGKALNYLPDSMKAKRSFYINGALTSERTVQFRNAWIDTFTVVSPSLDSIRFKYTVQKEDGYFDGEERMLPIFKQGVKEADGFFAALRRDTSFTLTPKSDTGLLKLYAETSVLPALEKEVENLRAYEYLCNEQLASKLKGLLVQKRIDSLLKRPFRYTRQVNDIIAKLTQARQGSGLWGWWATNEPVMWISLHVAEALVHASVQGFAVSSMNKTALTDYLVFHLENKEGTEQLSALHLLQRIGARADYKKYSDSLRKELPRMNLYQKLRLAELEQKAGLDYNIDSLLKKESRTMMGNVYWGEEGYRFFDNAIQNTVVMYRILKAKGGYDELLEKMCGYFLEKRRSGAWRNTYESSLILEAILPDLLVNDSLPKASTLIVGSQTVSRFPFATEVRGGRPLTISKQGAWPVYFTAYEERWNPGPQKVAGEFTVNTVFEKAGEPISKLKGGEPVTLKATVAVKADAEYVMVEIPVPAGCSYNDKRQSYMNNEVHREYFKNKVSIFCSRLKKGEYVFTVSLLPRYSGQYNLNPAKAELMYFPVFYGREGMKKITVQ